MLVELKVSASPFHGSELHAYDRIGPVVTHMDM